jgi:hypothetical protein
VTLGSLAAGLAVMWAALGATLWMLSAQIDEIDREVGRGGRGAGGDGARGRRS